jgi:hypothetical protein
MRFLFRPLFASVYLLPAFVLFACSSHEEKTKSPDIDSLKKISSVSDGPDKRYNYKLQLFKIDPAGFRLNTDDLPFQFDEAFLRQKKIRSVTMTTKMLEGKYQWSSQYKWEINDSGKVVKETRTTGKKTDNSIERIYSHGMLAEVNIQNPGDRFESSIKKIKYQYANNRLMTVYDYLENGDTIITDYKYDGGKVTEKITRGKEGIRGSAYYNYIDGNLVKVEFYNGPKLREGDKKAIYTYTYTRKGKLLYGDHWYPGISNDSYIFEFDDEDQLVEITYKIFLKKEELKIPGKTKSYRFEYDSGELVKINYFMQATDYSHSGTFEFGYEYYYK